MQFSYKYCYLCWCGSNSSGGSGVGNAFGSCGTACCNKTHEQLDSFFAKECELTFHVHGDISLTWSQQLSLENKQDRKDSLHRHYKTIYLNILLFAWDRQVTVHEIQFDTILLHLTNGKVFARPLMGYGNLTIAVRGPEVASVA